MRRNRKTLMRRHVGKGKLVFIHWGIPFVLLFVVIGIILIHFSVMEINESTQRITEEKEEEANTYAKRIYNELDQMTRVGVPAADVLGSLDEENGVITQNILMALSNHTLAYQVVYADAGGRGKDQKGNPVNISVEPYYQEAYGEQQYQYIENDLISNRSAIVSIVPVKSTEGEQKALYLYYPVDRFQELFKNITYVKDSFCVLMIDEGKVIQSVGSNRLEGADTRKIWNDMKMSKERHRVLTQEKEEIFLSYAPLNTGHWYIVVGTNYNRIRNLINNEWKMIRQVIGQLLITIIVFIVFVISITIINKMNYNRQNRTLEIKADTDLLTELYNKIATEREIQKFTQENPHVQSLFFLVDIDNFKKINDTMGHAFGDEVLRTIGTRLKVEFRKSDIIGRIGGDELLIFLKNIQDEEVMQRQMGKVRKLFDTMEVGEYVKYKVTASIGAAIFPQQGKDFSSLYAEADKALYIAKENGKNCMYCAKKEIKAADIDNLHRNEE